MAHGSEWMWSMERAGGVQQPSDFIPDVSTNPTGMSLARQASWVRLNRLRYYKWAAWVDFRVWRWGTKSRNHHTALECPKHWLPNAVCGLAVPNETINWFLNAWPEVLTWLNRISTDQLKRGDNFGARGLKTAPDEHRYMHVWVATWPIAKYTIANKSSAWPRWYLLNAEPVLLFFQYWVWLCVVAYRHVRGNTTASNLYILRPLKNIAGLSFRQISCFAFWNFCCFCSPGDFAFWLVAAGGQSFPLVQTLSKVILRTAKRKGAALAQW